MIPSPDTGSRDRRSGTLLVASVSPHPPITVPEVGRGEERAAGKTVAALKKMAERVLGKGPDTVLIVTSHGPAFADAISIRCQAALYGDLSQFRAPQVSFDFRSDDELVSSLKRSLAGESVIFLDEQNLRRYRIGSELDHGVMVPLYFLREAGFSGKLVVVNIGFLPYLELYRLGTRIASAIEESGKSVAAVASGDLSHRLTPDAPAGYSPRGKDFDDALVKHLAAFDVASILSMDSSLIEAAGECGLRPIVLLLGCLDRAQVKPEILSYEGPFGVGYCVAVFDIEREHPSRLDDLRRRLEVWAEERRRQESFPVKLARRALEHYVRTGHRIDPPENVPEEFSGTAGVFVSIHREGALRGCIGTISPARKNVAEEIIHNAIEAGTRDPRFPPVMEEELDFLDYSVDVLSPAEPTDERFLDPKKYGVIVEARGRRGLLLPDLEGVDTAEEQLAIARRKAGILPGEKVKLYRFTVQRYH